MVYKGHDDVLGGVCRGHAGWKGEAMSHRRRVFHWTTTAVWVLVVSVCTVGAQQASSSAPVAPTATHNTLVNDYCLSCHNDRTQTAGLALDTINGQPLDQNWEAWEKVARKLRARQMPPLGARRPDDTGYTQALASLEASLDTLAASHPNPGRTET